MLCLAFLTAAAFSIPQTSFPDPPNDFTKIYYATGDNKLLAEAGANRFLFINYMQLRPLASLPPGEYAIIGDSLADIATFTIKSVNDLAQLLRIRSNLILPSSDEPVNAAKLFTEKPGLSKENAINALHFRINTDKF